MANVLPREKRLQVLKCLVNGNGERQAERLADVNRRTVRKLNLEWGQAAVHLHNQIARDLVAHDVQLDEIWGYVGKKEARVQPTDPAGMGEAYTFTALDTASRFIIAWMVGKRSEETTKAFVADVRSRLVVMPAITSDGFTPYPLAIGTSFGPGVDYAVLNKNYRGKARRDDEVRYEPPRDPFITKRAVFGAPNLDTASTSYVERNNGTMRHMISRLRRLTCAFSKALDNHTASIALFFVFYNLCHVPRTLRITPAMAIGVQDHVWDLEELLDALESVDPCEAPEKQPLRHRVPEGPARELPNGRGFLRLVGSGEAPPPAPMPPAPIAPVASPSAEPVNGQLDLFSWRPKPATKGQLSLFPDLDPSGVF